MTPLDASKIEGSRRRSTSLDDRSAKLGHDIRLELLDIGESRIKAMDATGIDVQVLSLTMPGLQAFGGAIPRHQRLPVHPWAVAHVPYVYLGS